MHWLINQQINSSDRSKFTRSLKKQRRMKKALRETQTLRALAVVRFGHRPPAHPPARCKHAHRQDRLQYTAPQLASAQCKDTKAHNNGNNDDLKTHPQNIKCNKELLKNTSIQKHCTMMNERKELTFNATALIAAAEERSAKNSNPLGAVDTKSNCKLSMSATGFNTA